MVIRQAGRHYTLERKLYKENRFRVNRPNRPNQQRAAYQKNKSREWKFQTVTKCARTY